MLAPIRARLLLFRCAPSDPEAKGNDSIRLTMSSFSPSLSLSSSWFLMRFLFLLSHCDAYIGFMFHFRVRSAQESVICEDRSTHQTDATRLENEGRSTYNESSAVHLLPFYFSLTSNIFYAKLTVKFAKSKVTPQIA